MRNRNEKFLPILISHFSPENIFKLACISFLCLPMGCIDETSKPSDSHNGVDRVDSRDKSLPSVQFADVTSEAGILFQHTNGASGRKYLPESNGSGALFFDYDNDDDLDLYIVNGADFPGYQSEIEPTNTLYRNEGDGTFTDVTSSAGVGDTGFGQGCAAADYDNDGDQDIYVTNFGANVLYQNNGDGTFTDVTDIAGVGDTLWGTSCAFADYDNDGDLDLYVVNYLLLTVENHKECTVAGYPIYCRLTHYDGAADILYRNNGEMMDQGPTFTNVTRSAGVFNPDGKGLGVVFCDYDNDGDQDIYVANDMVRNFLYRNEGNGTFKDVSFLTGSGYNEDGRAEAGMGTDFGDFNQDGFFDIFVKNYQGETNTLYLNEGNGFFSDISLLSGTAGPSWHRLGWGTKFFDHDNDGDLDIFVANGHIDTNIEQFDDIATYKQKNLLFDNGGSGQRKQFVFSEISEKLSDDFLKEEASRGAAFGDYDNDGDTDIFITNVGAKPTLLRNDGGNKNNWLMVITVGAKGNRDALGARVTVISDSLKQVQEVKSGSSYLSQNDLRLLFGLGKRTRIGSVIVRWPGGNTQSVENIGVNQILTIIEQ